MEKTASEEAKARMVEKSIKSKVISKAAAIINKHFSEAISEKEEEIDHINSLIVESQKTLHLLRYGSVSKTYAAVSSKARNSHGSLHPQVKVLVTGKSLPNGTDIKVGSQSEIIDRDCKNIKTEEMETKTTNVEQLPGYVAPATKKQDSTCTMLEPRGHQHKCKRRFVVGNVSKWIECDQREDASTHKWMLYVRGCKDQPNVSDVVKKVRFFIHQTYHPNNVVDVSNNPFHLIRRGWGEFPARIQIHFHNPTNKPVDVMHNLKLDKTYTGLQTLGAETVVDVWLNASILVPPPPPPPPPSSKPTPDERSEEMEKGKNVTIAEDAAAVVVANGGPAANKILGLNGVTAKEEEEEDGEPEKKKRLMLKVDANYIQKKPLSGGGGNSPVSVFKTKDIQSFLKPGASLLKKLH